MKHGFVISMDAMLALAVTFILFVSATAYLATVKSEAKNSAFLKDFSMDTATVLEKSGELKRAVNGSGSEIANTLNRLPEPICIEVQIFNASDLQNAEISVLKNGCNAKYFEKAIAKRGFYAESKRTFYLAKISAWYKVA